jgi:hypothetical protein
MIDKTEKERIYNEFRVALSKTLKELFGGEAVRYEIIYRGFDYEIILKYKDENCDIEFERKGKVIATFKCNDDLEATILKATSTEELKRFLTFETRYLPEQFYYKLEPEIVSKICDEMNYLRRQYVNPLKTKIVKTVSEEYVRCFKASEKFGKKEIS